MSIMVSFEVLKFYCKDTKQLCLLIFVIVNLTADQTLSLHFTVGWFCFCGVCFMIMQGSKEKIVISSSSKIFLIPTFIIRLVPVIK